MIYPVIFKKDKSKCCCGGTIDIIATNGMKHKMEDLNKLVNTNGVVISHMLCDKCGSAFYISWDVSTGEASPIFCFEEEYNAFMNEYSNAK